MKGKNKRTAANEVENEKKGNNFSNIDLMSTPHANTFRTCKTFAASGSVCTYRFS